MVLRVSMGGLRAALVLHCSERVQITGPAILVGFPKLCYAVVIASCPLLGVELWSRVSHCIWAASIRWCACFSMKLFCCTICPGLCSCCHHFCY